MKGTIEESKQVHFQPQEQERQPKAPKTVKFDINNAAATGAILGIDDNDFAVDNSSEGEESMGSDYYRNQVLEYEARQQEAIIQASAKSRVHPMSDHRQHQTFDIEDDIEEKKLPYDKCLTAYDFLKFVGAFLFLSDLMLKIAYYQNSRFGSEQVYELYYLFLIARPVLIGGYMVVNLIMQLQWLCVYRCGKNKKPQKKTQSVEPNSDVLEGGELEGDSNADRDSDFTNSKVKLKNAKK